MSQKQFISFTIGDEEYGVNIMAIREIKGWTAATELPDSPSYMRGVINLRGAIVPILDLSSRFNRGHANPTPRHVIIVVALGNLTAGLLVDAVADVLSIDETSVQPIPELECHAGSAGFLTGLVTVEGRMVALLDLDHVFDTDTVAARPAA